MSVVIDRIVNVVNMSPADSNEVDKKTPLQQEPTQEYKKPSSDNVIDLPAQRKSSTIEILKSRPFTSFTLSDDLLPVLDEQYELIEMLGSGGMANVFKAQKDGLYFALKLLKDELLDKKRLLRFRNEIVVMKKFNLHPNIISIVDSGSYMGRPCIVEEFADGGSLHERMKVIHLNEFIEYMVQVSGALNFVHKNGYIHRDLKPGNIFLSGNIAKLGDFGVTKIIDSINMEDRITSEGIVLGTLEYVSPEEAHQILEPVDDYVQTVHADIYSLGVILYKGLTGQFPIQIKKGNNKQVNVIVALKSISTVQPKSISELNPNINTQLDATVMKLLEKDPQVRARFFNDALAVTEKLAKHLNDGQILIEEKAA